MAKSQPAADLLDTPTTGTTTSSTTVAPTVTPVGEVPPATGGVVVPTTEPGNGLALTTPSKTPARAGVVPATVEEAYRLAKMLADSELVPQNFQKRPNDIVVAVQWGAELGLPPMTALQSIAVINGRPALWGDGLMALVVSSPDFVDCEEFFEVEGKRVDRLVADDWKKDTTAAVCVFIRRGKTTPVTRRFTVAQARKASLLGKSGPWQSYPDRMLQLRARSFAARDAFADVLRGIGSAEELRDIPPEDPPRREVRRLSDVIDHA